MSDSVTQTKRIYKAPNHTKFKRNYELYAKYVSGDSRYNSYTKLAREYNLTHSAVGAIIRVVKKWRQNES